MNFGFSILDFGLAEPSGRAGGAVFLKSKIENQKSKIPRAARGFSLVEVLMALTIFALAAIVLGSSYANVLNSYAVAARTAASSEDLAYARSLVLTQPDLTKLQDGGEFDTASGRHAKWTAEITPTTTADLFTVVFTCEISAANSGDPEKTVQTFTLLRPTWSIDPAARSQLRQDTKNRILELQGKIAGGATPTGRAK
jgi:general secretion pathway protein I